MFYQKKVIPMLILAVSTGCAANAYKSAPSANIKRDYQRQQLKSPVAQQAGGAALAGLVGGLLGPIGILVTAVGTGSAQVKAISNYLSQMNGATLVGEVIEDATKKRNAEFKANPRWFKSLPEKLPSQYNIDLGSGNSFVFPVKDDLQLAVGDVVTISAPSTVDRLAKVKAEFTDLPVIVGVRCKATDKQCKQDPENELGIAERR